MAGSNYGAIHEANMRRCKEFYEIARMNRFRLCMVGGGTGSFPQMDGGKTAGRRISNDWRTSGRRNSINAGYSGVYGWAS